MNRRFQNFLSLFTAVGTLCLFSHSLGASGRGANDTANYRNVYGTGENFEISHIVKLPAKAYGNLPQDYQYFDVPGCGMCGYWAIFLSFEAAVVKPDVRNIELVGKDVAERLGEFSNYIAKLRKRERLPLKVREAFEALAWEVAFYVRKDAFDLTEGDWKSFFDALAGGGVLLDAALLPLLAWWLRCDIIVMRGGGQEETYSGVFPEEEKTKTENFRQEEQPCEQAKHVTVPEVLKIAEVSKGAQKAYDAETSKISEDSDTSESSEEESEEESENTSGSDDPEEEDQSPKCTIRVFYAQNGDKGHYWAVIPDQFHEIEEDKDPAGSARISLWRTVKKSCH